MTNPATRIVGFLAVLFLVVGAAVALDSGDDGGPTGFGPPGGRRSVDLGDVRLVAAESCDELVTFFREAASLSLRSGDEMEVLQATGGEDMAVAADAAEESSAGSAAAPPAPSSPSTTAVAAEREAAAEGGADGDEFSGTNLQERDVDEPDTVKT
ncbi:MAG TPA: hypothetical protein VEA78_01560, partial [Acidimicrobiales bacterium]|nr:hypothetical protein [Acidimicrobiales bacterium]